MGSVTLVGPVTKKKWVITRYGTWIPECDADLLGVEVQKYCARTGGFINMKAIYETAPSAAQMLSKPKE